MKRILFVGLLLIPLTTLEARETATTPGDQVRLKAPSLLHHGGVGTSWYRSARPSWTVGTVVSVRSDTLVVMVDRDVYSAIPVNDITRLEVSRLTSRSSQVAYYSGVGAGVGLVGRRSVANGLKETFETFITVDTQRIGEGIAATAVGGATVLWLFFTDPSRLFGEAFSGLGQVLTDERVILGAAMGALVGGNLPLQERWQAVYLTPQGGLRVALRF